MTPFDFVSSRLDLVFLVYGLAFFAMGLAVALERRRSSATVLASSLGYLAAFALLHAPVEWLEMLLHMEAQVGASADSLFLQFAKVSLLVASAMCLVQFGARLLTSTLQRYSWVRWLPAVLFIAWLASFIVPHLLLTPVDGRGTAGLSSSGLLGRSGVGARDWLNNADVWARYLLYFPGSVLAALALVYQRPFFLGMHLPRLARDCIWVAVAFGLNAVVAGLVVPPAPYPPASILNYSTFQGTLQVPPQILRALAAAAIAFFVVRILSVFEIERRHQLDRAQQERCQAQQETLEAQRHVQEEMERWNRELEDRVLQRTRELQALNEQVQRLAVLEERERIAREMHDSLAQALGYLSVKTQLVESLLAANRLAEARAELRRMGKAADDAYADVRECILGLRTSVSPARGLLPTLREYLRKFSLQNHIAAELVVADGSDVQFSPEAEVQLIRIIQEALTNVRKHAGAERAWVRFEPAGERVVITVEDDGRGFDTAKVARRDGHQFGLQTMQERAESVGGELRVDSAPGKGTRIVVTLACEAAVN